jgi:hypothetical protein
MRTALALFCVCFCASAVRGAAIYSASASSTFTMDGGQVLAQVLVVDDIGNKTETGAGHASYSGSVSGNGVLPATSALAVSGGTPWPPNGHSSADYHSSHMFIIDNSFGASAATQAFQFTFAWNIEANVCLCLPQLDVDFAQAEALFQITGLSGATMSIGGVPVGGYLLNPSASRLNYGHRTGQALIGGVIDVPAGSVGTFMVITNVAGEATSIDEVPEPSTILLAGAGLSALAGLRALRRR